ncbi:carotenoid ester lipase precursor [Lactifluus volemus]|nr:carotenoid ester lipase precursor [Lactifluus volemus]
MRITPFVLTFFAGQASFAFAISFRPFLVQDQKVRLDDGTFIGTCQGKTAQFLGIPYAQPPTCHRRLRLPEALGRYKGRQWAHSFGPSCPQQRLVLPPGLLPSLEKPIKEIISQLYEDVTTDSEDCLTINSRLPVVVWIFGGGFEVGGTATYPGGIVVSRSVEIGEPIIFVSMNYRWNLSACVAFGFLPGKEVKQAKIGNLGLQDQRLALKWVQKYISAFGGDPSKVTIWGESAGAISVALHMLVNKGNQGGLFRGAVMQSGGPIPVGNIENGQQYYDWMVDKTACSGSLDTLECLRNVSYGRFKYAMDTSPNFFAPQGLALAWLPRPPQHSVLRGHVANVPMIQACDFCRNCEDEGSLFSLAANTITTTAELGEFLTKFMMPTAKKEEVDLLLRYYPDDPKAGCPFDTGLRNMYSLQFKRLAAIQGDIVFHGPRRLLLKYQANKQKSWAFLHKRGKDLPFIGAAHGTDILNAFGVGELKDYIIYFTRNLNPNSRLHIPWPQYDLQSPKVNTRVAEHMVVSGEQEQVSE